MAGRGASKDHHANAQRRMHSLEVLEAEAMTQSNPGTLQSIYNRSRRICADKAQAHLRDFAKGDNSRSNSKEETVRSDMQEVA